MLKRLTLLLILICCAAAGWGWHAYQHALVAEAVGKNSAGTVEIERGDSFRTIVDKLRAQRIDVHPFWFRVIALRNNVAHKLKAGEYEMKRGMTMPELLALFVSGKTRQYSITFPEGLTFAEIWRLTAENPHLKHILTEADPASVMARLGMDGQHPEGWFFPETYYFEKQSSDLDLLRRANNRMRRVLQQEWDRRAEDLPLQSAYEALTLASIVEKETAKVEERPRIAGVFIRRLQQGMLLQTDPTVIYGMGARYEGNIQAKDLKEATPYNTYVIKGLPPTPIAMPGQAAIHAVLHPEKDGSLYFVARGDGSHAFSSSLREHNRAVDHFQRKRR